MLVPLPRSSARGLDLNDHTLTNGPCTWQFLIGFYEVANDWVMGLSGITGGGVPSLQTEADERLSDGDSLGKRWPSY